MHVYHGTNEFNAKAILKKGFRKYSLFTPFLGTAISYGGAYVFCIEMPEVTDEVLGHGGWEFSCQKHIYPKELISLVKYDVQLLHYNPNIDIEVKRRQYGDAFCERCHGDGELHYPHDGHHLLPGGGRFDDRDIDHSWKIELCPDCGGHGFKKTSG